MVKTFLLILAAWSCSAQLSNGRIYPTSAFVNPQLGNITATPGTGLYSSAQTVTLAISMDPGSFICYTLDGTAPVGTYNSCSNGTHYTGAFSTGGTIPATIVLKAIGYFDGYTTSPTLTATYTIANFCTSPALAGTAGPYATGPSITITESVGGCSICYSTSTITVVTPGTCPGGSTTYSIPVVVSIAETLYAVATQSGYTTSSNVSQAYIVGGQTSISGLTSQSGVNNLAITSPFLTGSDASGYTVVGVAAYTNATAGGNFYVAIYASTTSACFTENPCPGTVIWNNTGSTATASSFNTAVPASAVVLAASTQYFVAMNTNNASQTVAYHASSNCPFGTPSSFNPSITAGTWPSLNATSNIATACYVQYLLLAAN